MKQLTMKQTLKYLITWLLHTPDPETIKKVMRVIEADSDSDRSVWRKVSTALKTVAEGFDTAVLIAAFDTAVLIAATVDNSILPKLRSVLKSLDINILTNKEERDLVAEVFADSRLKSLLTEGATGVELAAARGEFLDAMFDKITESLLFERRGDFYRIARAQARIHPAAWLPHQRTDDYKAKGYDGKDDEYFSKAIMTIYTRRHTLIPENLSAFVCKCMANDMRSSLRKNRKIELVAQ